MWKLLVTMKSNPMKRKEDGARFSTGIAIYIYTRGGRGGETGNRQGRERVREGGREERSARGRKGEKKEGEVAVKHSASQVYGTIRILYGLMWIITEV